MTIYKISIQLIKITIQLQWWKKKKNVVVTYRKDKFLDELWIDWQMLIPA